ncbi:hypothetical protein AB3R30_21250 [Leptolyngbyaceae cyanobacterium UHCC 1019]
MKYWLVKRIGMNSVCLGLGAIALMIGQRAIAVDAPQLLRSPSTSMPLLPDITPLDVKLLKPGQVPAGVVTAQTISLTRLTLPSLWWTQAQVAANPQFGNKLLENWIAYPGYVNDPGRVDLVVNRQLWSLLDYLQRYEFINRFSAIARSYGYNIRVFDNQARFAGAYTCDFSQVDVTKLQAVPYFSNTNQLSSPLDFYSRNTIADRVTCEMLIESALRSSQRELFEQLKK